MLQKKKMQGCMIIVHRVPTHGSHFTSSIKSFVIVCSSCECVKRVLSCSAEPNVPSLSKVRSTMQGCSWSADLHKRKDIV